MPQFYKAKIRLLFVLLFGGLLLFLVPAARTYAEGPYKNCNPSEVHPIWWKATIRYDVSGRIEETGERVNLESGDKVTVVSYDRTGSKRIMLKDGTHTTVSANAVEVYEDACTPGDYSRETKTRFVNSRKLTSKTKYLIWVSTDMQSLNIFTGSNRNWTLYKSYKCSTGMAGYETPIGLRAIYEKMPVCHSIQWESDLRNFLSFGGSGIHKWPGGGMAGNIGEHPCSHACIRLGAGPSLKVYRMIPVGTRLLVY